MITAAINFSITDIIVLQVLALVLGAVVHFVWVSRRRLQKMLDESRKENSLTASPFRSEPISKPEKKAPWPERAEEEAYVRRPKAKPRFSSFTETADPLDSLRDHIRQQQKSLDLLLRKVALLEDDEPAYPAPKENNGALKERVERLELQLEKKEGELQKLRQQLAAAQKMTSRIDEVYKEFDELQNKIVQLEDSARQAGELALELEEVKETFLQTQKELARKQEKLAATVLDNERLQKMLGEATDKLQQAGLQRQQLLKKVEFLESMNAEFQQLSDANKKMQQEIKRIAELESMLSIVSDERDLLLKRRAHQ